MGSGHARDHMNVGKESFKTRVFDQKKKKRQEFMTVVTETERPDTESSLLFL